MKNSIEILGIVLPAIIILLGIVRVFVKQTKGINGLTMLFAFLLLIIGLVQYFIFKETSKTAPEPKLIPVKVSKHSMVFNQSVENLLNAYFRMTDGFVNNDLASVNQSAIELKQSLDSFKIDDLKIDTLIYQTALQPYENAKMEVASIISGASIEEKKVSLNTCSNELYTLLRTVRYDNAKIYWRECPFAFGQDEPGNWLSKTDEAMNPYGKEDCADIRSTINFIAADTVSKQE